MQDWQFADDPAGFFDRDSARAHRMDRAAMEKLQLESMQRRFAAMEGELRALSLLSQAVGITEITSFDDAVTLFFPHALYKSYPDAFLGQRRFDLLTHWLQSFTTNDLSAVSSRSHETIDDWLNALDELASLYVRQSSGTTGKISFFPYGIDDWEAGKDIYRLNLSQVLDRENEGFWDFNFPVIHLSRRWDRSGRTRSVDYIDNLIVPPGVVHGLDEITPSVDLQHFMGRTRAATRDGVPVNITPSNYIMRKIEEQRGAVERHEQRLRQIHELLVGPLAGKFVMVLGGTPLVWKLAIEGLKSGGKSVLEQGRGQVLTAGGLKGVTLSEDWMGDLQRYFGAGSVKQSYGMTELVGGFTECGAGRYHCPPWLVPFVLDSETGRSLPRDGEQTGRGAFFDIIARNHWGGIVTADHVTISWGPCPCGRTSPNIAPAIARYADGSDDGLTAAAPRSAIDAVIEGCASELL